MPIYDVENRFSYYKNYSDNILVGPPIPTMGSSVWERSVSGSVVSGSEEYKASTILSDYVFKQTNPFYRSGEVRYLRLTSKDQALDDSITPDILSLYLTGSASGSIATDTKVAVPQLFSVLFATDGFAITSSGGVPNQRVNNTEFSFSFPYEKKYSYVPKQKPAKYTIKNITTISSGGIGANKTAIEYNNTLGIFNPENNIYDFTVICLTNSGSIYNGESVVLNYFTDYNGYYNGSTFIKLTGDGAGDSFTNPSLPKKLIFGIKPRPISTTLSSSTLPANQNYLPVYCTGSITEGWKYGLYNGIPTNFSCVFRQNHYGQPRDMLEGRIYTKTYNNPEIGGPLDEGGGINFISGSALSGESDNWLTASIYQSNNVAAAYIVNPYGSGIFDKEYRASQPWFDNDPRVGT